MSIVLKNGIVYYQGKQKALDVLIDDHGLISLADEIDLQDETDEIVDASSMLIVPGLIEPHIHLDNKRNKQALYSDTLSMAKGGYTMALALPNHNFELDSMEHFEAIKQASCIPLFPYATISKGQKGSIELNDIHDLSEHVLGFLKDTNIEEEEIMREAMIQAKRNNCIIVAYEPKPVSEQKENQLKRDLRLAKETGCQYHVCHLSSKESVELIRQAKKEGTDVSAEVSLYHLLLNNEEFSSELEKVKIKPSLGSKEDQQALLQGIKDGTIEMIGADFIPYKEESSDAPVFNPLGNELAFGLLYQYLVMTKKLSLEQLLDCTSYNVANIFGLEGGEIVNFNQANLAVLDLKARKRIEAKYLESIGKTTPFMGWYRSGLCCMSIVDGKIVYRQGI